MRWIVALLLLVGLPALAEVPPGAPVGFTSERWQIRQGRWRFEPDGTLLCEGHGLSSLLFLKGEKLRDLDLSVEVMFLGPESSAGLVFRSAGEHYYDDMSFYQFEWYTEGHHHNRRLSLMTKNPRWKQIVTPILRDPPMNRWVRFRVRAEGDHLQAFIDGAQVFDKRDRTFTKAGRLGLHVFQARQVRFRDLRIEKLCFGAAAAAPGRPGATTTAPERRSQ